MDVRFSNQADTDLIDSYLYGFTRFGPKQADRYERSLRHAIDLIAENPRLAAKAKEFDPPVRILREEVAKRSISINTSGR